MSQNGYWNTVTSGILEIWEDAFVFSKVIHWETLGDEKGAILCNLPPKHHPLTLIMANMKLYLK